MRELLKIKLMMHIVPSTISIVMLVLCVEDWPYVYYKALRFVICFSASVWVVLSYLEQMRVKEEIAEKTLEEKMASQYAKCRIQWGKCLCGWHTERLCFLPSQERLR